MRGRHPHPPLFYRNLAKGVKKVTGDPVTPLMVAAAVFVPTTVPTVKAGEVARPFESVTETTGAVPANEPPPNEPPELGPLPNEPPELGAPGKRRALTGEAFRARL